MAFGESRTEKVPVQLPGGTVIKVEVEQTGIEDVSFDVKPFKEVTDALSEITATLAETLQKAKPDKASVKFGLELAVDSKGLTAVIVKGSGKANLEITLEWGK
ncbi:MAG: CU044_2847 family protein [Xenococcaceae cyanobacterium]